ncbi:hypothetical protein BDZ45DRAFT_801587 [Acephala macrosclerotiorum]|nr:hypothetical protein BDZ45DRAFT_801587 [Acephala macrosclerotiorum]
MAEFGIIASSMGLWDDVQDAPDEIQSLLEGIETLCQVLSSCDDENLPKSAMKCLEFCSKVDRLRERLKSAQFMLMLASQSFFASLQKQHHEIQCDWAIAHQRELQELNFWCSQQGSNVQNLDLLAVSTDLKDSTLIPLCRGVSQPQRISVPVSKAVGWPNRPLSASSRRGRVLVRLQTPKWLSVYIRAVRQFDINWMLVAFFSTKGLTPLFPTTDCVRFAIKLLSDHDSHDQGSTVRLLLTGRKLDYTVCTVSDKNGNTLLSRLAWQLGEYYGNSYVSKSSPAVQIAMKSGSPRGPKPVKLLTLMLELIKGSSNLNSLFEAKGIYRTPLLEFICGGLNDHSDVVVSLKAWLELLKRAGTDLERYGRDEKTATPETER